MALSNAVPDPTEWVRQWSFRPGETRLQDISSKLITIGSAAMTVIVVASLLVFIGLGTALAQNILGFTMNLPLGIGEAAVLPALALMGGVIAVLYTLQLESIAGDRELLRDDANWIIVTSAATYLLAAIQVNIPFASTTSLTFVFLGAAFATLYVWRVIVGQA